MEMDAMYEQLGIERKVLEFGKEIEGLLSERFAAIDETAEYNQLKVIKAMQDNHRIRLQRPGTGYTGRCIRQRVPHGKCPGEAELNQRNPRASRGAVGQSAAGRRASFTGGETV